MDADDDSTTMNVLNVFLEDWTHRFIEVIDGFCMTKINSLPSADEHEKLGANQGFTSDLFCNDQGKLLFSVQP